MINYKLKNNYFWFCFSHNLHYSIPHSLSQKVKVQYLNLWICSPLLSYKLHSGLPFPNPKFLVLLEVKIALSQSTMALLKKNPKDLWVEYSLNSGNFYSGDSKYALNPLFGCRENEAGKKKVVLFLQLSLVPNGDHQLMLSKPVKFFC